MRTRLILTTALASVAFAPLALAQRPAEPPVAAEPAPPVLDPKACANGERARPSDTQETQGSAVPKDSLSEKLARTDGVICPPADINPDIRVPAPSGGANTPVIPPPGSPGGDPSIQPK
jgi:hypothetical protein